MRQAQFEEAASGKEREAVGFLAESFPGEIGLGDEDEPLFETERTGAGADGVGGFQHEQRLVAVDRPHGLQRLAFEVAGKSREGQLHLRLAIVRPIMRNIWSTSCWRMSS